MAAFGPVVRLAYPVRTAVGALGAVALGEAPTPLKLASVAAIAAGVAGLQLGAA